MKLNPRTKDQAPVNQVRDPHGEQQGCERKGQRGGAKRGTCTITEPEGKQPSEYPQVLPPDGPDLGCVQGASKVI